MHSTGNFLLTLFSAPSHTNGQGVVIEVEFEMRVDAAVVTLVHNVRDRLLAYRNVQLYLLLV